MPCLDSSSVKRDAEAVEKLRSLMDVVQEIKIEREKLEKEFTNIRYDLTSAFLKALRDSQIINEEEISTTKIAEIYGPLKTRVNESIKKQEDCLAQVKTWNEKFCSEKACSKSAAERERILKMLATGFDKFLEIKSNLEEGTKFYNDLTPLLLRLQQKVSDFCFARQTEKEDLMKQLQFNIVSGSSNSSAPRRPPPPKVPSKTTAASNPYEEEERIPPPLTETPSAPQNPNYQPQLYNPQQQQPFPPYAQAPCGYPPQQVSYTPQPQFPQNYTTPYPVAYPGTYPGAFSSSFNGYSQFPPTISPQWGNLPSSTPQ